MNKAFTVDPADIFSAKLLHAVDGSALCLLVSIGHRMQLFEAMARAEWMRPQDVAARSHLRTQPVRTWLEAMKAADVVQADRSGRFRLPPERAAVLATSEGKACLAPLIRNASHLGELEDRLVAAFETGVRFLPEEQERMQEADATRELGEAAILSVEANVLALVPRLLERLATGIEVLVFACNRGDTTLLLAERYSNSRFTGICTSRTALESAQCEADKRQAHNVEFIQLEIDRFQHAPRERYDLAFSFDSLFAPPRSQLFLEGMSRSLKRGGVCAFQDLHDTAAQRRWRTIPASLLKLAELIRPTAYHDWYGRQARLREHMQRADLRLIARKHLMHGVESSWYLCMKPTRDRTAAAPGAPPSAAVH